MPITTVVTSRSKQSEKVTALTLNSEQQAKLYTLVEAFLLFNPKPTDQQVHMLAKSVGMDKEEFERLIYQFFSEVLSTEVAEGGDVVDHTPLANEEHLLPTTAVLPVVLATAIQDNPDDENDVFITDDMFDDAINLKAGDEIGDAAEQDGAPDQEQNGLTDPMKEASENDGAPDTEQVKRNLEQDQSHA